MQYKQLGKSGLWVSRVVLGTMTFGDGTSKKDASDIFYRCLDAGVNLFDCADIYGMGMAEGILSDLIAPVRDKILVTTKAYFPMNSDPNDRGASRLHLTRALERSLSRLKTDYVDIFFVHHYDETTPLEETLLCLDDFVRQGKVRYLGVSNFSAWQTMKALQMQRDNGWNRISVIQPMYNLLKRQAEVEIFPMAQSEGLGVLSYSPLAAGMLTGKYAKQGVEGRLNINLQYKLRYDFDYYPNVVKQFVDLAMQYDMSPAALAVAWAMHHPAVTAPIIGVRVPEHLDYTLASVNIKMTPELYSRISSMSPHPSPATDRAEECIRGTYGFYADET